MINALWITLVGMGLVFAAILMLWGLMALLVRLTREPEEKPAEPVLIAEPTPAEAIDQERLMERKRRAAAAGYIAALSIRKLKGAAEKPTLVSAWQAVHRSGQASPRSVSPRRKVTR
jgi:hypothetical protein